MNSNDLTNINNLHSMLIQCMLLLQKLKERKNETKYIEEII